MLRTIAPEPETVDDREGPSPRVLIVDDDPAVRNLVSILLQRRGMTTDTAPDGEIAIGLLAQRCYDAILLDLLMPRLDGHGVIAYMRDNQRTDPVIVMSAALDESTIPLDPSIVRVAIRKPLIIDDLNAVVSAIVQRAKGAASPA